MKDLLIEKSHTTPLVQFHAAAGTMLVEGRSIPEDPESFFEPLLSWIHEYFKQAADQTRMSLKLEYVNSGTSKYLMEILRVMKGYHEQGKKVLVNWYYEEEDESMYELGCHYKDTVDLPFRLNVIYE